MQKDTLNLLFTKPRGNSAEIQLRLWSIAEGVARRFKVPDGNAEDLTADIFIHLLKKIPKLKPGNTAMGFFQRTARNKALELTCQTWNHWRREHGARMNAVESAAAGGRGGEGKVVTPAARRERRGTPPRPRRKVSAPEYITSAITRLHNSAASEDYADAVHVENALLTARELIVGTPRRRDNRQNRGLWIEVFSVARIDSLTRATIQKSQDNPAECRVAGIHVAAFQALRKSLSGKYLPCQMPGDRWTPTRRITHDVGSAG